MSTPETKSAGPAPSHDRATTGSAVEAAEKRGYGRGYIAGRCHQSAQVRKLEDEIRELKAKPPSHDETVAYLLTTAEALTTAARLLIEMRTPKDDPQSS